MFHASQPVQDLVRPTVGYSESVNSGVAPAIVGKPWLHHLVLLENHLGMGQNTATRNWTAGFSLWFPLPGQAILGTLF